MPAFLKKNKNNSFWAAVPIHRIFWEMKNTAYNSKNNYFYKYTPIECRINSTFIWGMSQVWNHDIDNYFPKKQKYWCIDFTDCTYSEGNRSNYSVVSRYLLKVFKLFEGNIFYNSKTCIFYNFWVEFFTLILSKHRSLESKTIV